MHQTLGITCAQDSCNLYAIFRILYDLSLCINFSLLILQTP